MLAVSCVHRKLNVKKKSLVQVLNANFNNCDSLLRL